MYNSNNGTAKRAIRNFCASVVAAEISEFCRNTPKSSCFTGQFSSQSLSNFSWMKALDEGEKQMPMLTSVLQSALFPGSAKPTNAR